MTNIIFIAVALALDAFAVALGLGCGNQLRAKEKFLIVLSFGFFQGLFAIIGAQLGNYINSNLFDFGNYIGGIIILIIGILFLKEGYESDDACVYMDFSPWTYIILGISVSIDALGIGFSVLYNLSIIPILSNGTTIAVITAILTALSLMIVKYIKNFGIVERYANYLGGAILVIFGLNMLMDII
ncbi:manganese efflux pump MntP [Orenia marismortui]|uniref:manganese efflux pump MntP n=1 Tax=Orenia marismortui TaxID=46469 RepID=UPI000366A094|nr:manganese efflux pump [Orenia marismortui]